MTLCVNIISWTLWGWNSPSRSWHLSRHTYLWKKR